MIKQTLEKEGLPSYEYRFNEDKHIFQVYCDGKKEFEGVCQYHRFADDGMKMQALEQDMKFFNSVNPSHYRIITKAFLDRYKNQVK